MDEAVNEICATVILDGVAAKQLADQWAAASAPPERSRSAS
jgi:hypothetical protein